MSQATQGLTRPRSAAMDFTPQLDKLTSAMASEERFRQAATNVNSQLIGLHQALNSKKIDPAELKACLDRYNHAVSQARQTYDQAAEATGHHLQQGHIKGFAEDKSSAAEAAYRRTPSLRENRTPLPEKPYRLSENLGNTNQLEGYQRLCRNRQRLAASLLTDEKAVHARVSQKSVQKRIKVAPETRQRNTQQMAQVKQHLAELQKVRLQFKAALQEFESLSSAKRVQMAHHPRRDELVKTLNTLSITLTRASHTLHQVDSLSLNPQDHQTFQAYERSILGAQDELQLTSGSEKSGLLSRFQDINHLLDIARLAAPKKSATTTPVEPAVTTATSPTRQTTTSADQQVATTRQPDRQQRSITASSPAKPTTAGFKKVWQMLLDHVIPHAPLLHWPTYQAYRIIQTWQRSQPLEQMRHLAEQIQPPQMQGKIWQHPAQHRLQCAEQLWQPANAISEHAARLPAQQREYIGAVRAKYQEVIQQGKMTADSATKAAQQRATQPPQGTAKSVANASAWHTPEAKAPMHKPVPAPRARCLPLCRPQPHSQLQIGANRGR